MSPAFSLQTRLLKADPQPLGDKIPTPLQERAKLLCRRVYDSGREEPTRRKLVAALLLAASNDPDELHDALRAYDRAQVKDALTGDESVRGGKVYYPARHRGRPPAGR